MPLQDDFSDATRPCSIRDLEHAASNGETAAMKYVRRGMNFENGGDNSGNTPLLWAITSGYYGLAARLVALGADVRHANNWGDGPLQAAAAAGDLKTMRLLLEHGADINQAGFAGSPLIAATRAQNTEAMKFLIGEGADLNTVDVREGRTALFVALGDSKGICFDILMAAGADVNKADRHGQTPLMFVATRGAWAYLEALLKAGAKPDLVDDEQRTALHYAAAGYGRPYPAYLLRMNGAPVEARDKTGRTALMAAIVAQKQDMAAELTRAGDSAYVNTRANDGRTALHFAAALGLGSTVEWLVKYGANPRITDDAGKTPADAARDHPDIRRFLEEAAAKAPPPPPPGPLEFKVNLDFGPPPNKHRPPHP
jgi:ankyrin repeat protein